MKICFINRINDRSETALGKGLAERGHELVYVGDPADPDVENYKNFGIKTIAFRAKSRLDLNAVRYFKKFFRENKFDVVYCPAGRPLSPALIAVGNKSGLKFITYRGSLTTLSFFNPLDRLAHLSEKVSLIICNSQAVSERLREFGVNPEKLKVIYKGHEASWYEKLSEGAADLRLPADKKIIGCVANFRPTKGALVLIKAVHRLINDSYRVQLLLVGNLFDPQIERLIAKLGIEEHVTLTGFRKDAVAISEKFDVAVMPSLRKESLSRAIVESMFRRVPVIASNVGGMSELIKDGYNGFLTEPGDDETLAKKLKVLLYDHDLQIKFSTNAFDVVNQKFSVADYITEFERIFAAVAENQN